MIRRLLQASLLAATSALAACVSNSSAGVYLPPPAASYAASGPAYAPGGYHSSARQSLAEGDVAGAEAGFEQALNINPFDPIALNNLAVARTEAGQFHEALELLQRANRLAPQNAEIAANLARLRSWNQNYAMQDGTVLGQAGAAPAGGQNLPPEPPMLWDTRPPVR